ncbi:hypothetical protein QAD02_003804 [Eretmocerus hayati]|uniref:Uncharacterized protein n=1 Tax=Eretmocerus hayati TaxID=131215 RepID=A0ACC2NMZ2_9HYME|nr:hypothetical protein QAD02_003804 [Eretmocerus hayati]
MGYQISRSAMYTRVLPRNSHTNEGERNVKTVPITFTKAQNNSTKWHPDAHFCTASIRLLESLASLTGPGLVFFLSQDDKARVHIGVRAANKQSAILMHVDYKVSLPDDDFVVGSRHELIPSVYAGIVIKPRGLGDPKSVSYSGPTYVAIRSGKHDSSTAASHAADFKRLLGLENFLELSKIDGRTEPIVIISADGGPDENPRYPKVISWGIELFISEDLDGLFVVTNAPGHNAFRTIRQNLQNLWDLFCYKKAATDHMKSLNHAPVKAPQKSRIKRIEAQRKEEVLCIMQEHGASTLTAEWIMEDHIQNHDSDDCIDNREKERDESDQFPEIKNLPEWLESPWVLDAHS